MAVEKKYRFQIDLSEEAYQELKRLQVQDGVSNERELIKKCYRYASLHFG